MTVYGICGVKDAADIIGPVVANMIQQVDHVIVADNLSTDGTFDVLENFGSAITLLVDDDPAHYQSQKMTALADRAEEMGADWVVPFDADEIWYSPHGRIGDVLDGLDRHALAPADLYDHVPSATDDDAIADPVKRVGWRRRNPGTLPKVAARTGNGLVIGDGNHAATYHRFRPRSVKGQLVVRHFPYRSPEQFVRKALMGAAALKLTNLPASTGAHWRQYADLAEAQGEAALQQVYLDWFYAPDPYNDPTLIFDPAPCLTLS